uniref:BESS domain-containing protein n=1 Tax=Sipha flava TaxID=143950 RepID=A0A2S2QRM1_9HEMI
MAQQWEIFESMSVSKDSTTTKKMFCNVSETNVNELSIAPLNNYLTKNDASILETSSITQNTNYMSFQDKRPLRKRRAEVRDTMNACQKRVTQKFNFINEKKIKDLDDDENYQFLMSLLPHLRDIPKHRKLIIRHKLQKVFIDEEERNRFARYTTDTTHHTPIPSRPPPPYPTPGLNFVLPQTPSATYVNAEQSNIEYSTMNLMCYDNNTATNSTVNTEQYKTWTN